MSSPLQAPPACLPCTLHRTPARRQPQAWLTAGGTQVLQRTAASPPPHPASGMVGMWLPPSSTHALTACVIPAVSHMSRAACQAPKGIEPEQLHAINSSGKGGVVWCERAACRVLSRSAAERASWVRLAPTGSSRIARVRGVCVICPWGVAQPGSRLPAGERRTQDKGGHATAHAPACSPMPQKPHGSCRPVPAGCVRLMCAAWQAPHPPLRR